MTSTWRYRRRINGSAGRRLCAFRQRLRVESVPALRLREPPPGGKPDAMILMGNFAGEANRTPELLEILRRYAVEPRVELIETTLARLQKRDAVHGSVDRHTVATLCFGSYFASFYRGDTKAGLAERVTALIWPAIAK
ncbi:hypothetical protein AB0N99_01405 [Streptomyces sp. NPDC093272]|uniref:hypothetical protein n=1 Tax=unclassified Streptomyces TaxID=2593676 RepID=UPI00343AE2BD